MLELVGIKSVLLKKALEEGRSDGVLSALSSLNKNKKRPLGKFNPWAWCLEPVRGCNLACWHCPVSVDENLQGKYEFMSGEPEFNSDVIEHNSKNVKSFWRKK